MTKLHKMMSRAGLAAMGMGMGMAGSAQATVLDFANTNCATTCSNFAFFLQSYGDQAGLDVSYQSLSAPGASSVDYVGLKYWQSSYGDLQDVAWGGNNDSNGVPEITFTLTAPGTITLNGLDYAGWPATDRPTDFRIYDLSYNLLFSSGALTAPGTGHSSITFGTSSTTGLRLQWGPNGFNAGIDNLDFTLSTSGAVPEPASWALMITGFGLVGSAMRRRAAKVSFAA
jgi:PEP-CTERM motif